MERTPQTEAKDYFTFTSLSEKPKQENKEIKELVFTFKSLLSNTAK
jgi:hypothetical protein